MIIDDFDKIYIIQSFGIEAYLFLFFQRQMLSMMKIMAFLSIFISLIGIVTHYSFSDTGTFKDAIYDFFFNNRIPEDYTQTLHLVALFLFSFLHFRYINIVKREARKTYFDRFDKMSRNKNVKWLSARTLHISGLLPQERNSRFIKS